MMTARRAFLGMSAAAAGVVALSPLAASRTARALAAAPPFSLPPPISAAERLQRIARAQTLMRAAGLKAVLVEAGSSLVYFTGVQWWRSERLTAAVIPAEGDTLIVTPAFEEPSVRETLGIPAEVRVWNEHESPHALIVDWLRARRIGGGPVGVENTYVSSRSTASRNPESRSATMRASCAPAAWSNRPRKSH